MQRDLELVRKILLSIEAQPHGFSEKITIPTYDDEVVGYHIYLMGQAGLLNTIDVSTPSSKSPCAIPTSMRWEGHEFLSAARNDTNWRKAIARIGGGAGTVTLEVLKSVLVSIAKESLGLGK